MLPAVYMPFTVFQFSISYFAMFLSTLYVPPLFIMYLSSLYDIIPRVFGFILSGAELSHRTYSSASSTLFHVASSNCSSVVSL